MRSVFDKNTREELINRIDSLTVQSKAQWGKITVAQMVKHCVLCEEYYFGNMPMKRALTGRIFGKMALKSILKNESSGIRKNASTPPPFKVTDTHLDLETEKAGWKGLIAQYGTFKNGAFTHWFFGAMTKEQLGQFIYKHSDHHLRQFGQ